jgi:hypothetical protein
MFKDSTTLRHFALKQVGNEYLPSEVVFKGKKYDVYFEWCDDEEVETNDRPMNGIVQFVRADNHYLDWDFTYWVYRKNDKLVLGDFYIHPELEAAE